MKLSVWDSRYNYIFSFRVHGNIVLYSQAIKKMQKTTGILLKCGHCIGVAPGYVIYNITMHT